MFNIPWYSWLNLLSLPVVWILMIVLLKLARKPKWIQTVYSLQVLSCALVLALYTNQALVEMVRPGIYLVFLMAISLPVWNTVDTVLFLGKIAVANVAVPRPEKPVSNPMSEKVADLSELTPDANSNVLDLDATSPSELQEHREAAESIGEVMSAIFGRKQDGKSVFDEPGEAELQQNAGSYTRYTLASYVGATVFFIPPAYMSLRMMGLI